MGIGVTGVNGETALNINGVVADDTAFTILGWFNHADNSGGSDFSSLYDEDGGFPQILAVWMKTDGAIDCNCRFDSAGVSAAINGTSTGFDDDNWHWFCFTRRSSTDFELIVDGVSEGTSSNNPVNPSMTDTFISNANTLSGTKFAHYIGLTTGVTLGQAKGLAYGRFGGMMGNANFYLPMFNDNYPTDLSGNQRDITFAGSVTSQDHPPLPLYFGRDIQYDFLGTVGGRIMSSLVNAGGLASHGGLAGYGGGLAG